MRSLILKTGNLRTSLFLFCCSVLLWLIPCAHFEPQEEVSVLPPQGESDILLLDQAQSIGRLVDDWMPDKNSQDERMVEQMKELLSRVPGRNSEKEREILARALVIEAKRAGVDPFFLAALIQVESKFSNESISIRGARGLMQLMPQTGEEVARKLGMPWSGPEQLHDPEINIRLGVFYLKWLLRLYSGNYQKALTAYNRGVGQVRDMLRQNGRLEPESTEYFQKVQQVYRSYRGMFSQPVPESREIG